MRDDIRAGFLFNVINKQVFLLNEQVKGQIPTPQQSSNNQVLSDVGMHGKRNRSKAFERVNQHHIDNIKKPWHTVDNLTLNDQKDKYGNDKTVHDVINQIGTIVKSFNEDKTFSRLTEDSKQKVIENYLTSLQNNKPNRGHLCQDAIKAYRTMMATKSEEIIRLNEQKAHARFFSPPVETPKSSVSTDSENSFRSRRKK